MTIKGEHENALSIPPAVSADREGFELLRVWIADGGLHVTLRPSVWADPAAYGIALADLAKHIASAYQQVENADHNATLWRIREGFDAEWSEVRNLPNGSH